MSSRAGGEGTVRVVARVRPQNSIESRRGGKICVSVQSATELGLRSDEGDFKFTFDAVLGPESSQQECFDCTAAPITSDILQGYNATVGLLANAPLLWKMEGLSDRPTLVSGFADLCLRTNIERKSRLRLNRWALCLNGRNSHPSLFPTLPPIKTLCRPTPWRARPSPTLR